MKLHFFLYLLLFLFFFIEIKSEEDLGVAIKFSEVKLIASDNFQNMRYAFDNRTETQFKSSLESNGWVGMDFHEPKYISAIRWEVKDVSDRDYLLGVFECATQASFEDAIPLYMITDKTPLIKLQFPTAFQFIRYIGPSGSYCKVNDIIIYEKKIDTLLNYKPSNLPLIVIHSLSGTEPTGEDKIDATFYIINDKYEKPNIINGKLQLKGIYDINLYKKSYYIYFDQSQKVLDFSHESDKWALVSNYNDKSLIRNLVSFEISKMIGMKYTVECHPVDVMVNGEYKGTYNLCEKIEISENKINLLHGGYLLEIDGYAFAFKNVPYFISKKGIPISFKDENLSEEEKNYIKNNFYDFEIELYDNNLTRIDTNSFVKYFLLEEITGNDMAYWSTYIYLNKSDEKFYFGPIWDNDLSLDNDKRSYPANCKTHYVFNDGISAGTMDKIVNKILKNEKVEEEIKKVFQNLIDNNIINLNHLNTYIDNTIEKIRESRNLNFMRWNILKVKLNNSPKIYNSFEEEIDVIKDFIKNRMIWLKEFILGIKDEEEEEYNICEKDVDSPTSIPEEYDYSANKTKDDELSFQAMYYKGLKINLFNVLSRIAFIFLL